MSVNNTVANTRLGSGNAPDAGQELLNQVEDKFRRIPDNRHISSGKFDEPRARDMLDQVASMLDGEELEVPSVQKKRWRPGSTAAAGAYRPPPVAARKAMPGRPVDWRRYAAASPTNGEALVTVCSACG